MLIKDLIPIPMKGQNNSKPNYKKWLELIKNEFQVIGWSLVSSTDTDKDIKKLIDEIENVCGEDFDDLDEHFDIEILKSIHIPNIVMVFHYNSSIIAFYKVDEADLADYILDGCITSAVISFTKDELLETEVDPTNNLLIKESFIAVKLC